MAGMSEVLREVHRLRRYARELQEQIDRAPYQLKAQTTKNQKATAAVAEAQDALKKLKVATHEKEVSLKATHQQIAKYERQKDEAADSKAFQALGHEIDAANQKARALEDEILEAMTQTDEMSARLPELEAAKAKTAAEFATFETSQKERLARLSDELRQTMDQLKTAEEGVPPDFRPQYQRLVNSYGADALAAVEGHCCSQCHTQITIQQHHEVTTGYFICCKSCGRGLYLP